MSGSFRNVISIYDKSAIEPLSKKTLSIGITPGGFLYAVMDPYSSQYLALEEYLFADDNGNGETMQCLDEIIALHPTPDVTFKKIYISFFSPHYVIIPASVYDPGSIESYFSFCATIPSNHQLLTDKLVAVNAYGIYSLPNDVIEFCTENFKECIIRHQASVLIESIISEQQESDSPADVVLHLKHGHFEILLLHQQGLLCYQSFFYRAFDDVLYYLFYLMEQYEMDANQKNLVFIGEVPADSVEINVLKGFFNRVVLPGRNKKCSYSELFDQLPTHYYHNIFNLIKCE